MDNGYTQRINLVIDHIRQHLTDDLSLAALANIAGFSPFHFHRIFKTLTGETIADLTLRLRLERAAALLKGAPRLRITDAALECGFVSTAHFSRAFKKQFGMSPSAWDRRSPLTVSKIRQAAPEFPQYTEGELETFQFDVRVREFPTVCLAFIRVQNSYEPPRVLAAHDRLLTWYAARGGKATQLIGMSQDDPDVTPPELCRYDMCLVVPPDWEGEGEVSVREFPACYIASLHLCGDIYLVDQAWQYLYRYWLPNSRFLPDNLPAMEIYRRTPAEIGWETFDLECAIPVIAF